MNFAKERAKRVTTKLGIQVVDLQLSENLVVDPDPLRTAYENAEKTKDVIYIKKSESEMPGWEGEWDRVLRLREEKNPLMNGLKQSGDIQQFNVKKTDRHLPIASQSMKII